MTGPGTATDHGKALQRATLQLDEEFAERWVATMRKLVAEELDMPSFIERKMAELRQWTRDRKREQHNLNYKFDPVRRKPRLVERDVQRQLEMISEKLRPYFEIAGLRSDRGSTDLIAVDSADEAQGFREAPSLKAQAAREARERARRAARKEQLRAERAAPPAVRTLDGLNPALAHLIANDMGVKDLSTVTDEMIVRNYMMSGLSEAEAQQYVDGLARDVGAR
jgi:hypothetical protein